MRFEFSAGGIVYKGKGESVKGEVEILVCQHSQHHGWVFPKGLIGDYVKAESKEQTAIREVEEETGIRGKITQPLEPVSYWYVMDRIKRKKTVYYYLMEYMGGDINKHDWEMEAVEWLPIDKIEERLTFESDKEVWKEAKKLIRGWDVRVV